MCLAVPMRIVEREGFAARCEAKGVSRSVSLFLLQHEDIEVGDHVLVHVGYAIQKIGPGEAESAWELYDEMFAAEEEAARNA
jgi:hydrogenase expression/formation protein HypC